MNTLFRPNSLKMLDEEIERLVVQLSSMEPSDINYAKVADNLRVLCEAREKKNDRVISNDTLVAVGANIVGILLVLYFERTGVITSKAFGMLWKK